MPRALDGVRVLDCTHVLACPFAGRLLAELGAEVIKVEPPNGEMARRLGELYFAMINANKKCITINLKTEEGRQILYELVKKSDVFLTNYRYSTIKKLNISYDILKEVNPRLIYAHLSGFGNEGPYKDVPAHDIILQSLSGLTYSNGFINDPPVRCGPPIIDYAAGLATALSVVAALYYREKTGRGQSINVTLYDVAVMLLLEHLFYYFKGYPLRLGNAIPMQAPYNIYKAKDGYVAVLAGENPQWYSLLATMGKMELVNDPRFKTFEERAKHRDEIDKIVEEWTSKLTVKDAYEMMTKVDFPIAPVRGIESLLNDPEVKLRKMLVKVYHPELGELIIPASTLKLSETPGEVRTPGLPLGYSTEEVLKEVLRFPKEKIKELEQKGVIVCRRANAC